MHVNLVTHLLVCDGLLLVLVVVTRRRLVMGWAAVTATSLRWRHLAALLVVQIALGTPP